MVAKLEVNHYSSRRQSCRSSCKLTLNLSRRALFPASCKSLPKITTNQPRSSFSNDCPTSWQYFSGKDFEIKSSVRLHSSKKNTVEAFLSSHSTTTSFFMRASVTLCALKSLTGSSKSSRLSCTTLTRGTSSQRLLIAAWFVWSPKRWSTKIFFSNLTRFSDVST